jgi:uncharacterized membrane protein YbhN (UPF0104 family)
VLFAVRDNHARRSDIEREYRAAIHAAQREIVIANAFFIPGYRFLHELRDAARRGVRVRVIVQGTPDQRYAIASARLLYGYLAAAGVEIREYAERAFHGKVALVDDTWATVGSTNLEPLSLALNLEANVFVRDVAFNASLREKLEHVAAAARPVDPARVPQRPVRDTLHAWALFHFIRRYHGWAARMPRHAPAIKVLGEAPGPPRRAVHRSWRWAARVLVLAFAGVVATLLYRYARNVRWQQVADALAGYEPGLLAAAAALTIASFSLYASYDLLARRYAGHALPTRRVLTAAAISYAFNLNLGSLIGGAAFRYRLYSRVGLDPPTITRILGFSVTANWTGYLLLGGSVFAAGAVDVPEGWRLTDLGLRVVGVILVLAALGYLAACAIAHDRVWTVRGHEIRLPPLRLAVPQLLVAAANWLVIGLIMFLLLQGRVPFGTVLGCMLLGAIAGAVAHIPAGLGVLEVVLLTLLDGRLPQPEILAALFAYRGIYYIAPLALALVAYARFEAVAGRGGERPAGLDAART